MATRPTVSGQVYHLRVSKVNPYVLLPGDPDRVQLIASHWDEVTEKSESREYRTFNGKYRGAPITATSSGIGGPSASIAIDELAMSGARTVIRVGTTGSLLSSIKVGDLVISRGAYRMDGASAQYAPPGYPASPHPDVVNALVLAAEELGVRYHVGLTATTDTFYIGQGRPGFNGYLPQESSRLLERLRELKIINLEMETAVVLTIANVYGLRAGAIMAVIANRETDDFDPHAGINDEVKVANEAVKLLKEWDDTYPDKPIKSILGIRK